MSQREEFCRLARLPGANVRELCRRFGISRDGGYKWLSASRQGGARVLPTGRGGRSRVPARTPPEIEARVLALRAEHPGWGGRKLRQAAGAGGAGAGAAASTITAILRRHGLLDGRAPARRGTSCASSMRRRTICGRWTSRATSRWARAAAIR